MRLVMATHNTGKIAEMRSILAGLAIEVVSAEEVGIAHEPPEDGATFAENALIKARYVRVQTGEWSVADDSGLCVEALQGAPGVQTARYAGPGATPQAMVGKLLHALAGVPAGRRQCYFASAAALVSPTGEERVFYGQVDGQVAEQARGTMRPKLPYDVVFVPNGFTKTFAELDDRIKNSMSHRGKSFGALRQFIETVVARQQR